MMYSYNIAKLSKKNKVALIKDAIKLAHYKEVDQLDCSVSFARQPTDKTIEEVFQIGIKNKCTHYNFIYREPLCGEEEYFDVGFATMGLHPEYFLWLRLDINVAQELIDKYKLEIWS